MAEPKRVKPRPDRLEDSIWYNQQAGNEFNVFESERDSKLPLGYKFPLGPADFNKDGKEMWTYSITKETGARDIRGQTTDIKFHEMDWSKQAGMKSKLEYVEYSKKIEKERGIPLYNPKLHWHGIDLGQRKYETMKVSATHLERPPRTFEGLTFEQMNYLNNAAAQQMWDDIQRTCINGLDLAHRTIEKRFGKEVTPETINEYLENHNHNLASGSLIMEHMTETHPKLVEDAYVKAFTGNDELADELDPRWKIDINELFPEYQAAQIKKELGKKLFQVARIPTAFIHLSDGGLPRAWVGQQSSLAFLGTYRIPAGEAITSDFVYNIKHGDVVFIGTRMPWRRAKMVNSPGGISYGYLSDVMQTYRAPEVLDPFDPVKVFVEGLWFGLIIHDIAYLHTYLSGGSSGWTQVHCTAAMDDWVTGHAYHTLDIVTPRVLSEELQAPTLRACAINAEWVTKYTWECFDDFPVLTEVFYGGSQRTASAAGISAASCAYFTRTPMMNQYGFYHSLMLSKFNWGRLGFYAMDAPYQHQSFHAYSLLGESGEPLELRGQNYPLYNWSALTSPVQMTCTSGVHFLAGHAYCANPVVKVAFADPSLKVDYRYPIREWARGGVKEFMPGGERDVVIPAH